MTGYYIGCQRGAVDKHQNQNEDMDRLTKGGRHGCQEEMSGCPFAAVGFVHNTKRTIFLHSSHLVSLVQQQEMGISKCTQSQGRKNTHLCTTLQKNCCQLQLCDEWLFFHSPSDLSCFSNQEALLSSVKGTKQKEEGWWHQAMWCIVSVKDLDFVYHLVLNY